MRPQKSSRSKDSSVYNQTNHPHHSANATPATAESSNGEYESSSDSKSHLEPSSNQFDDEYRSVSFGALAEAQGEALRGTQVNYGDPIGSNASKVQALRERLDQLRAIKGKKVASSSAPESTEGPKHSKHAPMEQSSKRAVSRKRPALELPSNPYKTRDPRFSSTSGRLDEANVRKKYSFLKEYEESELTELKATLQAAKDPDIRERLKRQVMSLGNKIKATQDKEREKTVLREHRRREKDAVAQGKKPFYLKKKDQKHLALKEKFANMGSKDRDRAIQRRRKKTSERQRRNMPNQRRTGTD